MSLADSRGQMGCMSFFLAKTVRLKIYFNMSLADSRGQMGCMSFFLAKTVRLKID